MTLPNVMFKRYIVDVYGGQYATIRNQTTDDNPSIYLNDAAEIKAVADLVAANSTFIQSNISVDNQAHYIEMIGQNLADEILKTATIILDPDPRYAYDGERNYRKSLDSGNCTYILEHVQYPALWKIGFTQNMYYRSKQFYNQNSKIPVKPIALFQTDKNFELETYLHMAFAPHRKIGEWFRFQPIEQWLNLYRAIKNDETDKVTEELEALPEPYIW